MDEAPRHKKKAIRGTVPVYYRISRERHPEAHHFFQWAREWQVHKWYKNEETAAKACAVLNKKADIFEYSTEATCEDH